MRAVLSYFECSGQWTLADGPEHRSILATLIGHFVRWFGALRLLRCGGLTLLLPLSILR